MAFKEPSCLKRELLNRQSNLPFARNCYRFFVLIFGWRGNGFLDSLAFFVNHFWLPKSCLSIFTHGQTLTTPKQLIMHVEVMLRNMARLNRCINYCSFIWGGQSQMAYFFYCFVWEVISKTRASGFIRGSKHLETIKALGLRPRAQLSCFHLFLGVWYPWWNPRTRF